MSRPPNPRHSLARLSVSSIPLTLLTRLFAHPSRSLSATLEWHPERSTDRYASELQSRQKGRAHLDLQRLEARWWPDQARQFLQRESLQHGATYPCVAAPALPGLFPPVLPFWRRTANSQTRSPGPDRVRRRCEGACWRLGGWTGGVQRGWIYLKVLPIITVTGKVSLLKAGQRKNEENVGRMKEMKENRRVL